MSKWDTAGNLPESNIPKTTLTKIDFRFKGPYKMVRGILVGTPLQLFIPNVIHPSHMTTQAIRAEIRANKREAIKLLGTNTPIILRVAKKDDPLYRKSLEETVFRTRNIVAALRADPIRAKAVMSGGIFAAHGVGSHGSKTDPWLISRSSLKWNPPEWGGHSVTKTVRDLFKRKTGYKGSDSVYVSVCQRNQKVNTAGGYLLSFDTAVAKTGKPASAPATIVRPAVPPKTRPAVPPKTRPAVPSKTRPAVPSKTRPAVPPKTRPAVPPKTRPAVPPKTRPAVPPKTRPSALTTAPVVRPTPTVAQQTNAPARFVSAYPDPPRVRRSRLKPLTGTIITPASPEDAFLLEQRARILAMHPTAKATATATAAATDAATAAATATATAAAMATPIVAVPPPVITPPPVAASEAFFSNLISKARANPATAKGIGYALGGIGVFALLGGIASSRGSSRHPDTPPVFQPGDPTYPYTQEEAVAQQEALYTIGDFRKYHHKRFTQPTGGLPGYLSDNANKSGIRDVRVKYYDLGGTAEPRKKPRRSPVSSRRGVI